MPTIVLLGTLDTKGEEYTFVRQRLCEAGVETLVVDTGTLGEPVFAGDVSRDEVATAAGTTISDLVAADDRGAAIVAMAAGAAKVLAALREDGRLDGALALGGTGGSALASAAFQTLPLGVPKLIVSTAASGDTRPYVGETDLILAPSIVDVAGINRISAVVLANAAAAMVGMVTATQIPDLPTRALVGASMFGVTTPCVTEGRRLLDNAGYEVLVFHQTGVGGRTLESLAVQGLLAGIYDVTTTELADELVGGVFAAGPDRLLASGRAGIPRVVSVGALDMVNFGPRHTVPAQFQDRLLYEHNPSVTLMRTTPEECRDLGTELARRLSASTGPTTLILPTRGISAIAAPGGVFHDPIADEALFDAIRDHLDRDRVRLIEIDTDINDVDFARTAAGELQTLIRATTHTPDEYRTS